VTTPGGLAISPDREPFFVPRRGFIPQKVASSEPGSEQGGHSVGAANVLALHPDIGLFHQAVSFAATKLFTQSAACGGGMEAQTGRLKATSRILEKLTRRAGIVPSHGNPCKDESSQCLHPRDLLALEQVCIPFGGAQQRRGIHGSRSCGQRGPGAKMEEEYAHLLDA
jgi:hypothetical protein